MPFPADVDAKTAFFHPRRIDKHQKEKENKQVSLLVSPVDSGVGLVSGGTRGSTVSV